MAIMITTILAGFRKSLGQHFTARAISGRAQCFLPAHAGLFMSVD